MNFAIMGRLSSQMKSMEMETHWYLKKQSGKYNDKSKSLDEWLNSAQNAQEIQESASRGDDKLRAIHTKLFAGEELTNEEREYLKAKDPEAYRQLVAEEAEQKAYEEKLRKCRTKEEVDRLKMGKISKSLSTVKAVENNPYITKSQKLAIAMHEKRSLDRIEESTQKFIKSGEYGRLTSEKDEKEKDKTIEKDNKPDNNLENDHNVTDDKTETDESFESENNEIQENQNTAPEHKTQSNTDTKADFESSSKFFYTKTNYSSYNTEYTNESYSKKHINRKA